jgi:hypothetical protein
MQTYEVNIPGKGVYEVNSATELTDEQAYQYALNQSNQEAPQEPQQGAISRMGDIVTRGALPTATLTTTGALMGAPAGPAGMAAGALMGGVAIPASDLLVGLYNLAARDDVKLPSTAISELMDRFGLAKPESRGERMLEAGAGALSSVGGQLPAARSLAQAATSPVTRNVAQQAAQAPVAQVATAAPSAATAQYATEVTGSPLAGMLAGTATAMPFGVRPGRVEQGQGLPEVSQQARAAYQSANKAGLAVKPEYLGGVVAKIRARLSGEGEDPLGYDPMMQPGVARAIARFEEDIASGQPLSLQKLDNLRQILKAPAGDFNNPKQQMITSELVDIFDDALLDINPKTVIAGNAKEATAAIESARKLYTTQKKLQTIEGLIYKANISAGGYSQSGVDNALRVQFATLARNSKKMAQFNKTERAEIEKIATGGNALEKANRLIGKLAVRGPVTAAVQTMLPGGGIETIVASEAGKRAAEVMRQQNVQKLMEMISLGRMPQSRTFELLPTMTGRGLLSSQYGMEQ